MENSGEGDDQGSGWFEVKKKHRSSSKFSLQSWVGQTSGKSSSNLPCNEQLRNKNTENGKHSSHRPKTGGSYDVHNQNNSISVSDADNKGVHYLDKCVDKQDSGAPRSGDCQTNSQNHNTVVPKIKWGDLEDDNLISGEIGIGTGIKFGYLGDVHPVASRKHEVNHEVVSHVSSCPNPNPQGNKLVEPSDVDKVHKDELFDDSSCPNPQGNKLVEPLDVDKVHKDELFDDNCKDVNKLSSEDVKLPIEKEITISTGNDGANYEDTHANLDKSANNDCTSTTDSASGEEANTVVKLCQPLALLDLGDSETLIAQDTELVSTEKSGPENTGGSTSISFTGEGQVPHEDDIHEAMSNTQCVNALGEGDAGESKERFRERLWCFLFENLNRAVDELYLLCELECDVEQTKEAILVLEEAASDFKELNTRVEEFEEVRRSSTQLIDGVPTTLKNDNRRPHALSWEVRRMTTSPHRAEILSSSLEAFKKIQQERASMQTFKLKKTSETSYVAPNAKDSATKPKMQNGSSDHTHVNLSGEKRNMVSYRSSRDNLVQNGRLPQQNTSSYNVNSSKPPVSGKSKREQLESEMEKVLTRKEKKLTEGPGDKKQKSTDHLKRQTPLPEKDKEKEKRNIAPWKSMDAWKEKRNWEDILSSSLRGTSRLSYSPGMSRKSAERARILHDKLMTPDKKKKKTALDLKREAEQKHARAMKIRSELENERVQKLQRTSEKLNRVNEWQAVRTMKLREGMYARHQRSESRHEAFLAQVVKRAGDESSKVNEVRFITSLNEENKKLVIRQKLHDSELRRAEKLQVIKSKQKEDLAREEAVLERKKLIKAEKLQRLAEIQRKKEEAQVRREEERKASSAAREARAIDQLRRKEERAKAQQEEAELLAQKLAERLSESEQRRKFYLEQIRERASMDFRDQSSPLLRRSTNKEGLGRSTPTNNGEDHLSSLGIEGSSLTMGNGTWQHSTKRRIKRIRQRLMALKYEFPEPPLGGENVGSRKAIGSVRAKIGRWLQELQRLSQARKEGAASIGLIIAEMIKYLDGKDLELHASRQAGLLDFIASALPASHTSKPEACQVMIHFLKLLKVVLSVPANRSYFLAQNLLPPIIPMLSTSLENYIKIAASINAPGYTNFPSSKTLVENFESISQVVDGFLWTARTIIGHISSDERQLQMWDGLLELLIAYQVINRLRDLFALHDRPQVEGLPFPSSILSSIHLLVVLTSRPGTNSSINWESLPGEVLKHNESSEDKLVESADSANSHTINTSEDHVPPLSVLNGGTIGHISGAAGRLEDESCELIKNSEAERRSTGKDAEKEQTNVVEVNNASTVTTDNPDERQIIQDIAKPFVSQMDEKCPVNIVVEQKFDNSLILGKPVGFLLSSISDTGLVSLPSLLTSVLLQANNKLSSEQATYVLPSNFEEVATGVLRVLNNLALLDLKFMQRMLARPDLKMEFFHLMSFLLSHCTSKWKLPNDQIGLLLLESMLLLGHFALFHPGNQAVLRWGKSPTILHKVCDLPFVFFSDHELMPILASTLVAACYGCEQNKYVVQQELSTEMILSLLNSCKSVLPTVRPNSALDNSPADDSSDCNQHGPELKKSQVDSSMRPIRYTGRTTRVPKSGALGCSVRVGKTRNQKDIKTKTYEDHGFKQNQSASDFAPVMLHCRFPSGFIDRTEQFFSAGIHNG